MKAQLCPKCNGQGYVSKPPWVAGDQHVWSSSQTSFVCNVCHGLKILYVPCECDEIRTIRTADTSTTLYINYTDE